MGGGIVAGERERHTHTAGSLRCPWCSLNRSEDGDNNLSENAPPAANSMAVVAAVGRVESLYLTIAALNDVVAASRQMAGLLSSSSHSVCVEE